MWVRDLPFVTREFSREVSVACFPPDISTTRPSICTLVIVIDEDEIDFILINDNNQSTYAGASGTDIWGETSDTNLAGKFSCYKW